MKIISAGGTHIGKVRENNEDNFFINGYYKENADAPIKAAEDTNRRKQYVFAVCDGMGGRNRGETAALLALQALHIPLGGNFLEEMHRYIDEANRKICDEIAQTGERMGTTVALLMIERGRVNVCNIGDSRVYRLRGTELVQLSYDHTRVQQMIESGVLDRQSARKSKERHVLTQHLGIFSEEFLLDPYISETDGAKKGDMFLLCSDGLTDMMDDEEIGRCMMHWKDRPPKFAVNSLLISALEKGGRDNITAIVVKII